MQIDDFITQYKDAGLWAAISALMLAVLKMLPDYHRAKGEQKKAEAEAKQAETAIKNAGFDQLKAIVNLLREELTTTKEELRSTKESCTGEISVLQSAVEILKEKNDHLSGVLDSIKLHTQLTACPSDLDFDCPLKNTVIRG